MHHPRPNDLAHDMRNLVGIIRALVTELLPLCDGASAELHAVAHEIGTHSRFAIDALRVVEKWESATPLEFNLGAWGWALRLLRRDLAVGELTGARSVTAVVPQALAAGVALVDAMAGGRTVRVEPAEQGAVAFTAITRARAPEALAEALRALEQAGLPARQASEVPCRVVVG